MDRIKALQHNAKVEKSSLEEDFSNLLTFSPSRITFIFCAVLCMVRLAYLFTIVSRIFRLFLIIRAEATIP